MDGFQDISSEHNLFVVGDIHGCADEFQALIEKLPLDQPCAVVLVGDYIDRGPKSRQVIDALMELSTRVKIYPLMGNHESCLLEFLEHPYSNVGARFLLNGGWATLQSYSQRPGDYSIPPEHVSFVRSLKLGYSNAKHVFVHAGLPDVPLGELDEKEHRDDLLWVRRAFLHSRYSWEKVVVHGHTHCRAVHFDERRINVDTGCVFGNKLSAVHLPSRKVYDVPKFTKSEHIYLADAEGSRRKAVRFEGEVDIVVDREDEPIEFQSINYNDFGVLMRSKESMNRQLFRADEEIRGKFLTGRNVVFHFHGRIVWSRVMLGVLRCGVEFFGRPRSEDL